MPRMFMSVLSPQRLVALRRDRDPAAVFVLRGALGEPRKWWKNDEVVDRQQNSADDAGQRAGETQVCLPHAGQPRLPDAPAVPFGSDADQLRERVVHMKHLVAENVVKDVLGVGIGAQYVAINGEAAGRRFL